MRAVKTVISAAGNLKRENPTMNEVNMYICACCDITLRVTILLEYFVHRCMLY